MTGRGLTFTPCGEDIKIAAASGAHVFIVDKKTLAHIHFTQIGEPKKEFLPTSKNVHVRDEFFALTGGGVHLFSLEGNRVHIYSAKAPLAVSVDLTEKK